MRKRRTSFYSAENTLIKTIPFGIIDKDAEFKIFRKSGCIYFITFEFPFVAETSDEDSYSLEKCFKDNISGKFEFESEDFSVDDIEKNLRIHVEANDSHLMLEISLLSMQGCVYFCMDDLQQDQNTRDIL